VNLLKNLNINTNEYINIQIISLYESLIMQEVNEKPKNPNVIDSSNGKQVKSIYFVKTSKIGRNVKRLMWQYYRHRFTTKADDVKKQFNYQKKTVHTMEIIYSGDPIIYKIARTPIVTKKQNVTIDNNENDSSIEILEQVK
jgi:hypothetical protein